MHLNTPHPRTRRSSAVPSCMGTHSARSKTLSSAFIIPVIFPSGAQNVSEGSSRPAYHVCSWRCLGGKVEVGRGERRITHTCTHTQHAQRERDIYTDVHIHTHKPHTHTSNTHTSHTHTRIHIYRLYIYTPPKTNPTHAPSPCRSCCTSLSVPWNSSAMRTARRAFSWPVWFFNSWCARVCV